MQGNYENKLFLLALKLISEKMGWKAYSNIKEKMTLKELFSLPSTEFSRILDLKEAKDPRHFIDKSEALIHRCETKSIDVITIEDAEYPDFLKSIPSPPIVLFCRGNTKLLKTRSIAIVGTREPDRRGQKFSFETAEVVASEGFTVVSGMAVGIDASAHEGALNSGGKTLAVLGSGVDVVYPQKNFHIYDKIASQGLLVSEYLPETTPLKWRFPARNRIISGLSRAVLVVQAPRNSGALITAHHAFRQGKPVGAVPGHPSDPLYEGCNDLIKRGAKLITSPSEILDIALNSKRKHTENTQRKIHENINLTEHESKILKVIDFEGLTTDEIAEKTGIPISKVFSAITTLAIKELIDTLPDGRVIRI